MLDRRHPAGHLADLYDLVRSIRWPWENNPRQDRYGRRCDHDSLRAEPSRAREPRLLVLDLGCPCGRPVTEHRALGGPHTNPPGCRAWRPQLPPRRVAYTRAQLRPGVVVYPPLVGWLRGRPNRWARWLLDRRAAWCTLDDAPWLVGRSTAAEVTAVTR